MKNLSIELNWALENGELSYGKYSTDHKIKGEIATTKKVSGELNILIELAHIPAASSPAFIFNKITQKTKKSALTKVDIVGKNFSFKPNFLTLILVIPVKISA